MWEQNHIPHAFLDDYSIMRTIEEKRQSIPALALFSQSPGGEPASSSEQSIILRTFGRNSDDQPGGYPDTLRIDIGSIQHFSNNSAQVSQSDLGSVLPDSCE